MSLTYRRERRLDLAWEKVSENFNRTISAMRKKYGKIQVLRTWEVQNNGCPHIHGIFYFDEHEFETFFYKGKWRVSRRDDVLRHWTWGFGDVRAIYSLGGGVGYVTKFIFKSQDVLLRDGGNHRGILTLVIMCIFRKRAFSVSRGFEVFNVDREDYRGYVGQVDLAGRPIFKYYLVGFWVCDLGVWSARRRIK